MSTENIGMFLSEVATSEELQAKIGEEIDAEALIALGAECGYEFTAGELQEFAPRIDRYSPYFINAGPVFLAIFYAIHNPEYVSEIVDTNDDDCH